MSADRVSPDRVRASGAAPIEKGRERREGAGRFAGGGTVAVAWLLAALGPLASAAQRSGLADPGQPFDRIRLKSGREVEGRVVHRGPEDWIVRVGTRERSYARGEIDTFDSLAARLAHGLKLIETLPTRRSGRPGRTGRFGAVGLHLDVASQLRELGLEREAQLVLWTALTISPGDEAVHTALGSKRSGTHWLVPVGARPVPLELARSRAADWGAAWEFATTHFRLRSNLPLEACLTAAFDLERMYALFYGLLGEPLDLREIVEPLEVWVYADRRAFPEVSGHLGGYFSRQENRLHIDASGGPSRALLAHEATHQLLFNAARASRRGDGVLPGWVDEGLAQYFQAATAGDGSRLDFRLGSEVEGWLETHRRASYPFSLSRVLTFTTSDFQGSESRLKYAQAWSLVQYCLHGEDGALRPGFMAFLAGTLRGRDSAVHFERALDGAAPDLMELEQRWKRWVAGRYGG